MVVKFKEMLHGGFLNSFLYLHLNICKVISKNILGGNLCILENRRMGKEHSNWECASDCEMDGIEEDSPSFPFPFAFRQACHAFKVNMLA